MSKTLSINKQQYTKNSLLPKRRLQKSLPLIHNKKVPIHHIQSRKSYLQTINKQPSPQPKHWAYVPIPSKCNDNIKYNVTLSNSKVMPNNPQQIQFSETINPSLTLLDKYFQRKHKKRLKDVIKFIQQTSDQTNLSVGFQQLSIFETVLNKKSNDLSSTKKMKLQRIDALFNSTKLKQRQRMKGINPHFNSYIDNYKNSIIDDYFQGKR